MKEVGQPLEIVNLCLGREDNPSKDSKRMTNIISIRCSIPWEAGITNWVRGRRFGPSDRETGLGI